MPGERSYRTLAGKRGEELPINDTLGALADPRRRDALSCVRDADEPLTLVRLARMITAREADAPPTEVSSDAIQQVYLSLYHIHLPKLADLDLLTYDEAEGIVRGGETESLAPNLADQRREDSG